MAKGPRFERLVAQAKSRIRELPAPEAHERMLQGAVLVDVREQDEFAKEHALGAMHLSKGVIELRIEQRVPDPHTTIVCYCGGGSRSALVADALQNMGYTNVYSLAGGYQAWKQAELPSIS